MSKSEIDKIENKEAEESKSPNNLEFFEKSLKTKKYQAFETTENIENNNGSFEEETKSNLSKKDNTELNRCLNIAEKCLELQDFAKAISFRIKAYNIQPSPENLELLNNAKQMKEEHEREIKEKEELAKKRAEDKRKLDEERQRLCQQILKAKNVYEALNISSEELDENVKKVIRKTLIKIHPDKVKVSNSDDFKKATQIMNEFKDELDRRIKINLYIRMGPQSDFQNFPLPVEDEKSEESVDEFSDSYESEWTEDEAEFEEVQKRRVKLKKSNWYESQPYAGLEDLILNFGNNNLQVTPSTKKISSEFDDFDQYIEEFEEAFFLEVHEIIKKEIKDIDNFKVYTLILEEERQGYKVSHLNEGVLCKQFYDEIYANDLLLLLPYSGFGFKMSDEILISEFWLGIARKDKKNGSISIQAKLSGQMQLECNIVNLGNLTTLRREYLTLSKIEYALLLDYVLFPKPPRISSTPIVSEKFLNAVRNRYNSSQFEVLNYAFHMTEGLLIVQGPPGTGKTSTILGLISGYLSIDQIIRPRILVCAPSNAAIDEIASRAHNNGLFDENGDNLPNISMLRIGQKTFKNELGILRDINTKDIPTSVKEISLNYILETTLNEEGLKDPTDDIKKVLIQANELNAKLTEMMRKGSANSSKYKNLESEYELLKEELDQLYDEKNDYMNRQMSLRKEYIGNSDIIFCTTSTAGSADMLIAFSDDDGVSIRKFDFLIIDEACQSVELSILIPFLYDTSTVVLFGDPKQLPATTFADGSKTNRYNRSLFERMMDCNFTPLMLKIQYRMITELCDYPSMYIYNHMLKSDPSVDTRPMPPGIRYRGLRFFNLIDSNEAMESDGHSYYNKKEASFIVNELIGERGLSIGIISPYRAQVEKIKRLLKKRFGDNWRHRIEVDSVDGYQGREKDCIILSLVRSENIGFLSDIRRINVAITRGRFALNIVGNATCLRRNEAWDDLIDYCNDKNKLFNIEYQCPNAGWGKSWDENHIIYSEYVEKANEEQKVNATVPPESIYKRFEEKKSVNQEQKEAPKLGYKEVSIDIGVKNRRKEERKKIEEIKIPKQAANANANPINRIIEERKKPEEAKSIPKADKAVSEKNTTLPKKIPKMTNANIGGGFWNRRK